MKIIAAMMIKDEEQILANCLKTVNKLVDEMVIIDTGSTDKSVEIAKSFGATVYSEEWQNSFSIHRNQGIKKAEEHGADWILIIDADEKLKFEIEPEKVRETLKTIPEDQSAAALVLRDIQKENVVMQFNTPRFFRKGGIKYNRTVHNKPVFNGTIMIIEGLYVNHYGYDKTFNPEKHKEKEERRTKMLQKALEDNPTDYDILFYLNQDASCRGATEEALEYGLKYINKRKEIDKKFNQTVFFTCLRACISLELEEIGAKLLKIVIEEAQPDIDLALVMVEVGNWLEKPEIIESGAEKYLDLYSAISQDAAMTANSFVFSYNPNSLAYCINMLALVKINQGIFQLGNLSKIIPQLSDDKFKNNILMLAQKNLESLGVKELYSNIFEAA